MAWLAAVQPLLVGLILVWSCYGKLFGRHVEAHARRSALSRLVGERYAPSTYRAVGVVELVVGTALLLPPLWMAEAVTASTLAVGFLGYLGYAKVRAPESSCGCLGSAAVPVSRRSLARAGLLLVASLTALGAQAGWWVAVADRPVAGVGVVLAGLVLFVVLSAELDRYWLLPVRRLRVRLTHPLAQTRSDQVPLATSQQQLLRSPAYQAVHGLLRSDIREHWDDGEWRFVTYTASYADSLATAIFAVPLPRYEPDEVQVAIVDENTGETLFRHEPRPVLPVLAN